MAEHKYAGAPCGIMDQFVSVHAKEGHALLLDCKDCSFKNVPMLNYEVIVLGKKNLLIFPKFSITSYG